MQLASYPQRGKIITGLIYFHDRAISVCVLRKQPGPRGLGGGEDPPHGI